MSETVKRILSGTALAAITLMVLTWYDSLVWVFPLLFIMIFAILGVQEFYRLVDRGVDGGPLRKTGLIFSVLIVLSFYFKLLDIQQTVNFQDLPYWMQILATIFYPGQSVTTVITILFMISALSVQLMTKPLDGTIYSVSTTVFGVIYIAIPVSHALLYMTSSRGIYYLIFVMLATTMTDIGAYFAGRWFGQHNAGLTVSPKKTYEGYVGGFVFSIIIMLVYALYIPGKIGMENVEAIFGFQETVIVTLFISLASVAGDLAESALKRDAKKKDSASLIPGHGGFLDLADAIFFTLPLFYYYLVVRQMLGYPV